MIEFKENTWADRKTDRRTEEWKDRKTEGQTDPIL